MSGIETYMKREQNASLAVTVPVTIGVSDTVPLLAAPQGGATLLRIRFMPPITYAVDGSNYWTLSLIVYDADGTEKRTITLDNCGLNVLPFTKHKTMTWPVVGRFDERMDEGETVALQIDTTGSPGTDYLVVQLDYLRAGR